MKANFKEWTDVFPQKIVVKWRHLRPTKEDSAVVKYILKYKRRGIDPPEICDKKIDNTTKTKAIYGK